VRKTKKVISSETQAAILEAAWELIAREGRTDVGLSEIAAAAGVTRQTIFYAFGNRTGLLLAMVRHRDAQSKRLARMREITLEPRVDCEQMLRVTEAWMNYIPEVYPVASLLDAAAMTDPEARTAIEDRMVGQLLSGFLRRVMTLKENGAISADKDPVRLAEQIWETTHIRAWRSLVVERGWSEDEFKSSRLAIIRQLLGMPGDRED
jgi:AcrR family transcriptional regulator